MFILPIRAVGRMARQAQNSEGPLFQTSRRNKRTVHVFQPTLPAVPIIVEGAVIDHKLLQMITAVVTL